MTPSGAPHLVVGDEELLVTRGVAAAVALARETDPDAASDEYSANELTVGEFLGAVSPSLFGGVRVVVIRDAQDARKELAAALLSYAQAPEPEIVLVLTHAGGAKGKALADGLKDAGAQVTNAAKISRHRERIEFVRDEVRRAGGKCDEAAAEALLAAVGNDLRELAAACSQLVADALADGVRTVSRVASAGRGNAYQLATTLGLPPWKIERAQKQSRGWTPEKLAAATKIAAECNAAVKGGSEDRGYALESAVFALIAARGAGASRGSGS